MGSLRMAPEGEATLSVLSTDEDATLDPAATGSKSQAPLPAYDNADHALAVTSPLLIPWSKIEREPADPDGPRAAPGAPGAAQRAW
jgi:hypothetical protein